MARAVSRVLFCGLLAAVAAAPPAAAQSDVAEARRRLHKAIVVQREAVVRKYRRHYAPRLAVLREGDEVEILDERGAWYYVEVAGREGWLHRSAVTSNRAVVLSSRVVLPVPVAVGETAGRRSLEPGAGGAQRRGGTRARSLLERIDRRRFSEDRIRSFLERGRLGPYAEGRRR